MRSKLRTFLIRSLIPACGAAALAGLAWLTVAGPTTAQQPARAYPEPVLKAYACPRDALPEAAARLRNEFGGAPGVRIAVDERIGQILVQAPPEIHARVAQRLGAAPPEAARPPSGPAAANPQQSPAAATPNPQPPSGPAAANPHPSPAPAPANPQPPSGPASSADVSRSVPLRQTSARQIEASLVNTLGRRLNSLPAEALGVRNYQLALPGGARLILAIHHQANRVRVEGPGAAVDSCIRLIYALDGPPETQEQSMRLVSLKAADRAVVRRAVDAIRSGNVPRPGRPGSLVTMLFQQPEEEPSPGPEAAPPADEGAPPEGEPAAPTRPEGEAGPGANLIGPVQIELLEGLDVIVIRGHERDVEEVIRIIDQIEKLSEETVPAVALYHLQHVGSQALADLLTPLYDEIYLPRQGRVLITALVKPNSLLLVGRTEGVQTLVDLVKRLDRPVAPRTQFRVFRLRHAAALSAQQTIEQFFEEERPGLGANVIVTADYRSNAVIVYASPRDMAEVGELVARLDTPVSAAINELRVFKLENSMAEDLAAILMEAIYGPGYGVGVGARPGAAPMPTPTPAGVPGAAGALGQGMEQKATMLRFVTVDPTGRRQGPKSGILTDVRITADARANALLVSAPADSMDLLAALIGQLDKLPAAETQIKVFSIVNGDAAAMLTMLETLFGQAPAADQPLMQTSALEGESSLVPLRFAVDVRTNSIIASGTLGDLSVVEAILFRLDASDVRQRESTVYRLKNAPAVDVANAINEFLRVEREVLETTPGILSAFEQIEREVVVVSEPVSNSLIISATPRFFKDIMELVKEIDEQPAMVVIQVLIAEVTLADVDEFGVELGLQDSILFDRSTVVDGSNVPGFAFNNQALGNSSSAKSLGSADVVGSQGLTSFSLGRTNPLLGYGGLVLSASSESVSVLIRALKECRRLDVLARPQIMTLDNQPAQIQVGQIVSRVTGSSVSFNVQQTQVTDENVGLILGVVPRITPDGMVVMEIRATNSELGEESEGTPVSVIEGQVLRAPPIDIITAETTVATLDGQTVILGGLITKRTATVQRKTPFLGDLPLIGRAFRYDFDTFDRNELLIIMTPHVVRNQADAEAIKQLEAARMSWCLEDVIELHGDPGLRGRGDHWADSETIVIYPDMDPAAETIPAPRPAPGGPRIVPEEGNPFRPEPIPAREQPGPSPALPDGVQFPQPSSGAGLRQPGPTPAAATHLRMQSASRGGYSPPPYGGGVQPAVYQPPGPAAPSGRAGGPVVRSSYQGPWPPSAGPGTPPPDPHPPQYP